MVTQDNWSGSPAWLFLLGLVVFLGSGALFLVDLFRGGAVLRGVVGNAVGVAVLILWAAHDTLRNPDSEVATPAGAAGTALLLYGLYLLVAGAVIVLTGFFHAYMQLGFLYVGFAVLAVLVGYLTFPTDAVVEEVDTTTAPDDHQMTGVDGAPATETVSEERSVSDE
jgi:hypothetical protein